MTKIRFHSGKKAVVAAALAAFFSAAAPAAQIGTVHAGGFTFINFDPPESGQSVGSNANGLSSRGYVVGTAVNAGNAPTGYNFTGTPASAAPLKAAAGALAFGINGFGEVVGTANGLAFFLPHGGTLQTLTVPPAATNAFNINDNHTIVGQYNLKNETPGFVLPNAQSKTYISINAPAGPNVVNAQGINNFGLVVGFYLGIDGQTHGFMAHTKDARNGVLTGTAIPDPVIPNIAGEPGATFVFSQVLAVNDAGIAVGYYGDSTTSQHGFIYNTNTGRYTFLDDPSEAFLNGVEVTQITGINDSGELVGFYTDANGIAHSFTACPGLAFCPNSPFVLPLL
jgi:hypothetical protein